MSYDSIKRREEINDVIEKYEALQEAIGAYVDAEIAVHTAGAYREEVTSDE